MAIIEPANIKPGVYDIQTSYNKPTIGGPTNDAMPWNSNKMPNAFVRLSKPSKSTKMTDVRPTYAPIVKPNTTA